MMKIYSFNLVLNKLMHMSLLKKNIFYNSMKLKLYNTFFRNDLVNLNENHVASIDNFHFFLNRIHKI